MSVLYTNNTMKCDFKFELNLLFVQQHTHCTRTSIYTHCASFKCARASVLVSSRDASSRKFVDATYVSTHAWSGSSDGGDIHVHYLIVT